MIGIQQHYRVLFFGVGVAAEVVGGCES